MAIAVIVSACATSGVTCNRFAAPNGSDHGKGTARSPFRTPQKLVDSLSPGMTGCLASGTYVGDLRVNHGGSAQAPITLTGAPGADATVVGRIWLTDGANYVQVTYLHLDGRNDANLPSPLVDATGDRFVGDDVTNDHTAICFELGSAGGYGQARDTLLADNRIHGCGVMPPTNHQHGIYVGNSVGARIVDNIIYDNADRGIQLYWNAQQTTIAGNIIDRNGEGIILAGNSQTASSNNLITHNIITNSRVRADVESSWSSDGMKGSGNLVEDNCTFGGRMTIDSSAGGFEARDNIDADPGYVDPEKGDYSLRASSPCATLLATTSTAGS
ncbi:MAG: right-handed parallel beta-helix repeat-containing protein [Solirubrobacterales bacterium]|nr:right-handed parallel beta-helix repeat-containing protein [Solirubrobacterales bacterium]